MILSHRSSSGQSRRPERTVIRSSPRRSPQSNEGVENYQKQLQGQVRTMLAAMQERTHYRPTADSALMRWIVRHAAWLIPRFRGSDVQSPFHRAMGGPYRRKLVEFGETVLAHLPEVGKGSGNPNTEVGRQVEISERTMELCMREVYDDSQRTAGQKRTSCESSRPHRYQGRRQPMMQQIPEQYQNYMNTRTRMKKRTRTMVRTKNHQTSQTVRIMTWRERRFRSPTQLRRRARAEERSGQKHKRMCS